MTIDRVIRRRILLGLLIAASFGLLTAWYREVDDGPLHRAQGSVADAAVPLSAAVQRVARPFRDLWEWGRGLANARDEVQRLQKVNQQQAVEVARLEQQLADTTDYRTLLGFTRNPAFSGRLTAFTPRGADVIDRPVEPDAVRVLIDAGSPWEVELRAHTIYATALLTDEVNALMTSPTTATQNGPEPR